MATLAKLCEAKLLVPVTVRLSRREFNERAFFALPEFVEWLRGPLQTMVSGDPSDLSPREQFLALLRHYVTGRPMARNRMFKRLRPHENDVFELKTRDLRIFGWFIRPNEFVAVCGGSTDHIKKHDLYAGFVGSVVRVRAALDLDEPKCAWGALETDVVSV